MSILYSEFKRKFSCSMYKNLKINLAEMTFAKDFVNNANGDLYPVAYRSDDCKEAVVGNQYVLTRGSAKRLFCSFFPYATYEITFDKSQGEAGFSFGLPHAEASVVIRHGSLVYQCARRVSEYPLPRQFSGDVTMLVSCRPGAFDIYFKDNAKPEFFVTIYEDEFKNSHNYQVFKNSYVYLTASQNTVVKSLISYIDNGVSLADMRPIKYENGDVIFENGRVYFTASVRMQEEAFQGVFSWVPGTMEFSMTGAMFYDCGDNFWAGYVAPVLVYNRIEKLWYVWVSSFSYKHILACGSFSGDPRFGVNIIDVTVMDEGGAEDDISTFSGFKGDEDPDLFYDEKNNRWLMAICRLNPASGNYVYVFFESQNPFHGYTYLGKGCDGAETGGSFVKADGEIFFVCGNDFNAVSDYRIYSKDGMRSAIFNYPDGGFRGWGSIIPVNMGSRTRWFWLTFDRHKGSEYNWSYGNIYCFEA